jgi:hypothetical protein
MKGAMPAKRTARLARIPALAVVCGVIAAATPYAGTTESAAEDAEQGFIQRIVAHTGRTGITVRGTRELQAGTLSGKHAGWMRVHTTLTPSGVFSWNVLEEGGSDRTRNKVFRAVLETEAEAWRDGARDAAAVTPENYRFTRLSDDGHEVKFRLIPKREDKRLIDGVLTVSADGSPLRVEGTLAKSPSFFVKSVRVVREYGRFAGISLPTVLESTADVRFVGRSKFTMRYTYSEVNGRRISGATHTVASTRQ